ncbi:MAG: putative sulfate exporter family transporter [Pseudomonadota bacterium]|nr:putative sulfate exporter family transporter [Pseudomonadota bacterium]
MSLVTFGVIYFSAKRSGLDPRLAATLGTGGAVCGVSGAIAIGGAVGAKKQDVSVAISLVVVWAIVMIFVLPLAARALHLSTGVAGAWIGTSEFADAAVTAFTLMKVIGRDVWIGVWAFALSLIVTTRWERTGIQSASPGGAGEIWRRFPKFVLGFLIASAIVTVISRGYDYAAYKKEVLTGFVAPLQALRTFAFFLSIGLTTRLREFVSVGARPFYAFTLGVIVNVALGFVLSTQVFNDFWNHLGQ